MASTSGPISLQDVLQRSPLETDLTDANIITINNGVIGQVPASSLKGENGVQGVPGTPGIASISALADLIHAGATTDLSSGLQRASILGLYSRSNLGVGGSAGSTTNTVVAIDYTDFVQDIILNIPGIGGDGYPSIIDRAAQGEIVQVTGNATNGVPNTTTQEAIDALVSAGWPITSIWWNCTGDSAVVNPTLFNYDSCATSIFDNVYIVLSHGSVVPDDSIAPSYEEDSVVLVIRNGVLVVTDSISSSMLDIPSITSSTSIYAQDSVTAVIFDNMTLQGLFNIDDGNSQPIYESFVLIRSGGPLSIDDSISYGIFEVSLIGIRGVLPVDDSICLPIFENIQTTSSGNIVAQDSIATLLVDLVILVQSRGVLTAPDDSVSSSYADNEVVAQETFLLIDAGLSTSYIDGDPTVAIVPHVVLTLAIADSQVITQFDSIPSMVNEFTFVIGDSQLSSTVGEQLYYITDSDNPIYMVNAINGYTRFGAGGTTAQQTQTFVLPDNIPITFQGAFGYGTSLWFTDLSSGTYSAVNNSMLTDAVLLRDGVTYAYGGSFSPVSIAGGTHTLSVVASGGSGGWIGNLQIPQYTPIRNSSSTTYMDGSIVLVDTTHGAFSSVPDSQSSSLVDNLNAPLVADNEVSTSTFDSSIVILQHMGSLAISDEVSSSTIDSALTITIRTFQIIPADSISTSTLDNDNVYLRMGSLPTINDAVSSSIEEAVVLTGATGTFIGYDLGASGWDTSGSGSFNGDSYSFISSGNPLPVTINDDDYGAPYVVYSKSLRLAPNYTLSVTTMQNCGSSSEVTVTTTVTIDGTVVINQSSPSNISNTYTYTLKPENCGLSNSVVIKVACDDFDNSGETPVELSAISIPTIGS
jgi:hypothetical protein